MRKVGVKKSERNKLNCSPFKLGVFHQNMPLFDQNKTAKELRESELNKEQRMAPSEIKFNVFSQLIYK